MRNKDPHSGPTKLVLGFDIGTVASAVSYCILEQGKIPQIHRARFTGQGYTRGDVSVPSILYYDNFGDVRAIGNAALSEDVIERAEEESWTKAEWWKLSHHPKHLAYTHIKDDDIPPLPPGKSAVNILTDFIRYLFQNTIAYIAEHHSGLPWESVNDSIEYVFTHPNGWDVKKHYCDAIERAGLIPRTSEGRSRVHMLTEGEASLHYCISRLPENPSTRGVLVIDAGGGVIDLAIYSITCNPASCKEIAPAECCLQGSVFVTCRAATLLQRLLQNSSHSSPEAIADLTREFDDRTKLTISSAKKVARIRIGSAGYNNPQYNIKRGFLELSGEDATGLVDESVKALIAAFEQQLRFTSTTIDVAFVTGGFATNQWFWTQLRSYFESRGIELFRPDDDSNKAVANGAVLSRINLDLITSRFSHATHHAKAQKKKQPNAAQTDAIAKIMDLTGLEQVKQQILRIKGIIETMNRQGAPINEERLNLILLGNPGTGKTTVARLYAQFLESINALPGKAFLETTGSKLSSEGVQGAQKLIDNALKAGGGAIFIDEAYQLVSEYDAPGKRVLDFLLAEMENRVGTLVFVLAGYGEQMEKFFEHNPGLRSRFSYQLNFADFTDKELMSMFEDLVDKRYLGRMKVEDSIKGLFVRIAVRRLSRLRGRPGFGNARSLQTLFANIRERQAERLERERRSGTRVDDFLLTKEDLIGPHPSNVLLNNVSWAKLQGMIGLDSVKDSVRNLFALLETNYERELAEKEPLQVSLNRVFLGPPGTGKTTVAKLYGQVLADLGMLSNGEVVVKNPADFIGPHLGQSEKRAKGILESTLGKVLVIDEAYMLYDKNGQDSFKTSVIDTIVAEIQSVPGEDRCVLLLGYKDQMEEMFKNVNPGLARRFAIEDAFNFEDFTEPQLVQVLELKLKDQHLSATAEAKQVAGEVLSRRKNRPNFGNAGEVENLLGQAKTRYQRRMGSLPPSKRMDVEFQPQDFDPDFDRSQNASANIAKVFEDIVGCDEVIQKINEYQKIAQAAKGRNIRVPIPKNFVFKGPPGTGKTTIARKLGQVYYDIGHLASAEVVECSATDLVGQWVGHTGPKTKGVFEKALGKVLFIDEAYRLGEGHFAKEAMDEIVGLMTNERFADKLVIILAGYENEINTLLRTNPGLSSRFSEEVIFKNMSTQQCLELLVQELQKNQITIPELSDETSNTYVTMGAIIGQMALLPSWGNARDIKTLAERMVRKALINMANHDRCSVSAEEALGIMATVLQDLQARQAALSTPPMSLSMPMLTSHPPKVAPLPSLPPPLPLQQPQRQPRLQSSVDSEVTSDKQSSNSPPTKELPQKQPLKYGEAQRDPGVSDAVWDQLQADIRAQEEATRKGEEESCQREQELRDTEEQKQVVVAQAGDLERAKEMPWATFQNRRKLERRLEEARQRQAEMERAAAALKKKQAEAAERVRKEREIQRKLNAMGLCPAGFQWIRQASGYRCKGGSHFISHSQLTLY